MTEGFFFNLFHSFQFDWVKLLFIPSFKSNIKPSNASHVNEKT